MNLNEENVETKEIKEPKKVSPIIEPIIYPKLIKR